VPGETIAGDADVVVDKKKAAFLLVVILLLAAITYSNSFQNGFINWDDDQNVYLNKYIPQISLQNLKVYFTKPLVAMYTPLVYLSYAVDYRMTQLDPTGYHATNLLLHLINITLVFFLILQLTDRLGPATIVSLIFAVHPLNAAVVTPVSIRSGLLYTMFFLGALIVYIKYVKNRSYEGKYLLGAGVLFILSLLSKSAAVVFPLVMLLTDYYYDRKIDKKAIVEKVPFFTLSLLFGLLTIIFREDAQHLGGSITFNVVDKVFLTAYSTLFYAVKLVLPVNLSAYYPYPAKSGAWLPIEFYLALPALLIAVWALFKARKHRKAIVFGSLFYLFNIMLVLKIIPLGNEMVCDRYAYLPSVGLLMTAASVFYQEKDHGLLGKPTSIRVAGMMLLASAALFSWMSYSRNPVWKDNISFYNDILRKYHNVPVAYNNRGIVYLQQKANEKALADFNQAISLAPSGSEYYNNRGNVKTNLGDYEGALNDFDKAIALNKRIAASQDKSSGWSRRRTRDPNSAHRLAAAYNSRAELRRTLRDYDAALIDYGAAIEADPEYSIAYYSRASVYVVREQYDDALKDYNRAIELDPYRGGSVYQRRAYIHMIREDFEAALNDFNKAIELDPPTFDALYNRGRIRQQMKDYAGALEDYTRVIMLAPAQHDTYYNRGTAKWLLNDAAGACSDWRTAEQLGSKDSRKTIARYCS